MLVKGAPRVKMKSMGFAMHTHDKENDNFSSARHGVDIKKYAQGLCFVMFVFILCLFS